jgi:predicted transport protein
MSDVKLFSLKGQQTSELTGSIAALESNLQTEIEANMPTFLGMRFLATEYSTGKTHKGRIDTLGLDENNCPVIIEYKRSKNENVINQGLFYLDWLLDHQAEFQLLVMRILGEKVADTIEWTGTRLICIAADYNKFDEYAVQQIDRNIELMRYRYFGDDLLLLELVNAKTASNSYITSVNSQTTPSTEAVNSTNKTPKKRNDFHVNRKQAANAEQLKLYELVCDYADSLGDEVQRKELKFYTAFKRIRNFLSVQVWAPVQDPTILLHLNLNPKMLELKEGFSSDVSNKGHWGTGDLEVRIKNQADLEQAKLLIEQSYLNS